MSTCEIYILTHIFTIEKNLQMNKLKNQTKWKKKGWYVSIVRRATKLACWKQQTVHWHCHLSHTHTHKFRLYQNTHDRIEGLCYKDEKGPTKYELIHRERVVALKIEETLNKTRKPFWIEIHTNIYIHILSMRLS